MLIQAEVGTCRVLEIEYGGTAYSVTPSPSGQAWVPEQLGRALAEAKLAQILDERSDPPDGAGWLDGSSRYSPWVMPNFPTAH
jgi:hypothetical protein